MASGVIFRTNNGRETLKAVLSQEPLDVAEAFIEIVGIRPDLSSDDISINYLDGLNRSIVQNIGIHALCRELGGSWRRISDETQDGPF